MTKKIFIAAGLLILLSGCQPSAPSTLSSVEQKPAESPDQSSRIVELQNGDSYNLTAEIITKKINGKDVKMFGYNGTIPGPVIKVQQDSEIQLNFINKIDVAQTIHSHGVRLDYRFDGVPDISQEPVKVGETFPYTIKFPDSGTYWYHPHIREDYAQELGLYGNYVVVPSNPDEWNPVNREEYLFLDDILMGPDDIAPFSMEQISHALMGRFGNTFLVNGLTDYRRNVNKGEVVRIALTNSANTRTFNVSIPGVRMKLVGLDGSAVSQEKFVDSLLLSPSERAVIEVLFEEAGQFKLMHKSPDRTAELATFNVLPEAAPSGAPVQSYAAQFQQLRAHDITGDIAEFEQHVAREPDKKIRLTLETTMSMMDMDHGDMEDSMGDDMPGLDSGMAGMEIMWLGENGLEWEDAMPRTNLMSTDQNTTWKIVDEETGAENMDIDWSFARGEPVKIRIFNDPLSDHPMQHPIHFHGQRFLVLAEDGEPNKTLAWKDTTLVRAGKTVDILLDTSNPGTWMAHCHIAEHLHSGMMFTFEVN